MGDFFLMYDNDYAFATILAEEICLISKQFS